MRDLNLADGVTGVAVIAPVAISATGTVASSQVQLASVGFNEGIGILELSALNTSGTTPTLALKIQDSADGSTYADVSPALAFAGLTTTNVNGQQELAIDASKVRAYIQVVATAGGTSPVYSVGVRLLFRKKYL